jgi:hypothetical protein
MSVGVVAISEAAFAVTGVEGWGGGGGGCRGGGT